MSITEYKIIPEQKIESAVLKWRLKGNAIVFTNGCFDILHDGHLHTLQAAKNEGDILIVGLNSDASVKKIKGEKRPIKSEQTRANLLAAFSFVNAVVIFNEETPLQLIERIQPDILVKGGDWQENQIVGAEVVKAKGGIVKSVPYMEGNSSTNYINKIIDSI